MSNTYYRYKKTQTDKGLQPSQERTVDMKVSITAYVGGKGNPNCVQLTIQTNEVQPLYGTAYITLTEKEQDDLIAGILERRGMVRSVNGQMDNTDKLIVFRSLSKPISATGSEQSKIHPAETQTTQ